MTDHTDKMNEIKDSVAQATTAATSADVLVSGLLDLQDLAIHEAMDRGATEEQMQPLRDMRHEIESHKSDLASAAEQNLPVFASNGVVAPGIATTPVTPAHFPGPAPQSNEPMGATARMPVAPVVDSRGVPVVDNQGVPVVDPARPVV